MDKILLLASSKNLRQLYHELLFSKDIEIIPSENISDTTVLLMLSQYLRVIVFASQFEKEQIKLFLNLRIRHPKLSRTKLILIATDIDYYQTLIMDKDYILNSVAQSPKEITQKIKLILKTNSS